MSYCMYILLYVLLYVYLRYSTVCIYNYVYQRYSTVCIYNYRMSFHRDISDYYALNLYNIELGIFQC